LRTYKENGQLQNNTIPVFDSTFRLFKISRKGEGKAWKRKVIYPFPSRPFTKLVKDFSIFGL